MGPPALSAVGEVRNIINSLLEADLIIPTTDKGVHENSHYAMYVCSRLVPRVRTGPQT